MDDNNQIAPEEKPDEPTIAEPAAPKTGGYGKRPLWQWVLIYIVVGGILYYLIYLIFFAGKASGGSLGY